VNWFFLFIKQVNGKIYVNKDCKMNFDEHGQSHWQSQQHRRIVATVTNTIDHWHCASDAM